MRFAGPFGHINYYPHAHSKRTKLQDFITELDMQKVCVVLGVTIANRTNSHLKWTSIYTCTDNDLKCRVSKGFKKKKRTNSISLVTLGTHTFSLKLLAQIFICQENSKHARVHAKNIGVRWNEKKNCNKKKMKGKNRLPKGVQKMKLIFINCIAESVRHI